MRIKPLLSPLSRRKRATVGYPVVAAASLSLVTASLTPALAAEPPVSLTGSFASELGCDQDWTTSCAALDLTRQGDGNWTTDLTVPAGAWEAKVIVDHSFDQNYGVDGVADGPNIPLATGGEVTLRFTYDETSHRLGVTPLDLPGDYTAADAALVGAPVRQPGTGERFYFAMTDRFANGDTANDDGGLTGDRLATGFDPTNKGFYHGGDLAGLTDQLDYIQGLGTTAIWLTPSFANRPVQGTGADASAGYHGYWITDFTRIDPHLGTNAEMAALIDAAHAKGMKVYFDIITNHTADVIAPADGGTGYVPTSTTPYRDAGGASVDLHQAAVDAMGGASFPTFDAATSFPKTPVVTAENANAKTPAWLNDVTLYHNRGDSTYEGESTTLGDFSGLDDLMTENPAVVNGFVDVYRSWIDLGIDGFRIDTLKHVNAEFWQQWTPQILAYARDAGRAEFAMFGEVYDANPVTLSSYVASGQVPQVLDFAFQSSAVDYATGGSAAGLAGLYASDDYYTTPTTSAHGEPTFLGNHDMGRIGHFLAGSSDPLKRDELAHALMYLTRGQPVVYYGDEQGFAGPGGDKDARQDMFATRVDQYAAENTLLGDSGARDRYDTTSALYTHIAGLARLREAHPALAHGAQIERYADRGAGVYAFSRVERTEQREYLVAVNNATSARTVDVTALTGASDLVGIYGTTDTLHSAQDGTVQITVPALGAVVLRAADTLPRAQIAATTVKAPAAGAAVTGRTEVSASTTSIAAATPYAETSFAYRVAGQREWTALGVDDDGRPRVVHDTGALPRGSIVEYRAVTEDLTGHRTADSTYAGVGVLLDNTADLPSPEALVTVPGSHNVAMGCPGNWSPGCTNAALTLGPTGLYSGTFDLPAGDYDYKVAVGGTWDENYGRGGVRGGDNITYSWGGGPITFVYDPRTHYVTSSAEGSMVTLAGSFQDQLGCSGNWQPECLGAWLQDPDSDGVYTFATSALQDGTYDVKVIHGGSWAENYGADGQPGGANIPFSVRTGKQVVFTYTLATHLLSIEIEDPPVPGTGQQRVHWIDESTLAFPRADVPADVALPDARFRLAGSSDASLEVTDGQVTGGDAVALAYDPAGLSAEQRSRFPALGDYVALHPEGLDRGDVERLLTGQLLVTLDDGLGAGSASLRVATGVQIPGVLDDLYPDARRRTLGVTFEGQQPSWALWAPTAQSVDLITWPSGTLTDIPVTTAMNRQPDGTWTVTGENSWRNMPYRYRTKVYAPTTDRIETNEVTDPASVALTINSTHSVAVDLTDPAWQPAVWRNADSPVIADPVDHSIYELHVRDFSIADTSVPAAERGTYLAFTRDSAGMAHLAGLQAAGLTTVHLLPTFDIASIEENRAAQATPDCDLASFPADSAEQQACVGAVADADGFNWGYDPWHYSVPDGSYAVDANGGARVSEFRSMVGALHATGLQVVLDQVFNHTAASGQAERSVLDKIVPGYYHRLTASGTVETSTCCQNVATEHAMAGKLMVDSVVTWAKDYHVDGFRFDLMGHHSRQNMLDVRSALDALTLDRDGIDGKSIYLYGEGWNFGEVADNALFTQASQGNLGGTGIGTFSDRLRDSVRGGGPFDPDPRIQGFGSGGYTDPNGAPVIGSPADQLTRLRHDMDVISLGMAGNLAAYTFTDSTGNVVRGDQVDYNGAPAGYATQPAEIVSYVDAHDNETLFDTLTYKLPPGTSMADRVRMNTVSLATTALGQSPMFWHAGADMLRSKSLDRDSYNSGDWFNAIDWTGQDNGFGRGLPPVGPNEAKWPFMAPLLADSALKPSAADITTASSAAADLLRLRYSTPLFRLGDANLINQKVSFPLSGPSMTPGVLVMRIDDTVGPDVDEDLDGVLVVLNATPEATTQVVPGLVGKDLALSTVQANGSDPVVAATSWDAATGTVTVPARTAAVLVAPTSGRVDPPVPPTDPQLTVSPGEVAQGGSITVEASGFVPGENIQVWLHSTPQLLGGAVADVAGAATVTLTVPTDAEVGAHTVVAVGAGSQNQASASLRITAAKATAGGTRPGLLALTGAGVGLLLLLAALTIGTGLWLRRARRTLTQ